MHVQPGRGSAFVRTKLKNLLTGNTNEKTFRSGEKFELAEVTKDTMQYTYMDGDDYMFMNMETFEELRVPPLAVSKFVKEGMDCGIVQWKSKVIGQKKLGIIEVKVKLAKNKQAGDLILEFSEKPFILKKWIIRDIVGDETTVLIQNTIYNQKLAFTLFFPDDFPEPNN